MSGSQIDAASVIRLSSPRSFLALHNEASTDGAAPYVYLSSVTRFVSGLNAVDRERTILRHAVKNLWQVYRFNQHYIGFLGGGVSEEDFNKFVEENAAVPQTLTREEIHQALGVLLPLLDVGDEVTPRDVAVVLNADEVQMELTMTEVSPDHGNIHDPR